MEERNVFYETLDEYYNKLKSKKKNRSLNVLNYT